MLRFATVTLVVLGVALGVPSATPDEPSPTKPLARFQYGARVRAVAFSPDSRLLATAGEDRAVRIWEARSGKALGAWRHDPPPVALAFTPDGATLVLADAGMHVRDLRGGWRSSSRNLSSWLD